MGLGGIGDLRLVDPVRDVLFGELLNVQVYLALLASRPRETGAVRDRVLRANNATLTFTAIKPSHSSSVISCGSPNAQRSARHDCSFPLDPVHSSFHLRNVAAVGPESSDRGFTQPGPRQALAAPLVLAPR